MNYKKNILLYEECDEKREYLRRSFQVLKKKNYNLLEAKTEKEAYELFDENKDNLDAIITSVSFDNLESINLYGKMKMLKPDLNYYISTTKIEDNFKEENSKFYKSKDECKSNKINEISEYSNLKKIIFDTICDLEKN